MRPLDALPELWRAPQDGVNPYLGTGDQPAPPFREALLSVQGASPLHHFLSGKRMGLVTLHSSALFSPLSKKGVQLPTTGFTQPVPAKRRPTYFSINRICWLMSNSVD